METRGGFSMIPVVLIGDLHVKDSLDSPYNKGIFKFLDWIIERYPDSHILQSGDLFDGQVSWDTYTKLITYIRKFKKFYVAKGNHDQSNVEHISKRKGTGLEPLTFLSNTTVALKEPMDIDIAGFHFKFLPYQKHPERLAAYREITGKCDFSLAHTSPVDKNFGKDEVYFTFESRADYYGHIHQYYKGKWQGRNTCILGVPQPTREGEQHDKHYIMEMGSDGLSKAVEVPKFFDIVSVPYSTDPQDLNPDYLYNVIDAPDARSVLSKFKGLHIRRKGIRLERTATHSINIQEILDNKLVPRYKLFCHDNQIPQEVLSCGVETIEEIENS